MILVIRRMLLLVSLMFWQGGFMFYGSVVVPVGGRILGSETEQGFITQSVTNYLNLAGAVCLIVCLEHLWHDRRHGVSRLEWSIWSLTVVSVIVLAGVHANGPHLERRIFDRPRPGTVWPLAQNVPVDEFSTVARSPANFLAVLRWNRQDTRKA